MDARFLEDLQPGDRFTGPARTITETDVVAFAGLSGDFNPIHTDVEFAKNTPYRSYSAGVGVVGAIDVIWCGVSG